jgi:hypothetical protein
LQAKGATLEGILSLSGEKKIADNLEKVSGDIGRMVSRRMRIILDKNSVETL